jgi:hypothetical protein
MSFEGYIQKLCANGHHWVCDVYFDDSNEVCSVCGAEVVWKNIVDTTNGMYCDCDEGDCEFCDNGRIDGHVDLEVNQEAVFENCSCCGSRREVFPATYKIPNKP